MPPKRARETKPPTTAATGSYRRLPPKLYTEEESARRLVAASRDEPAAVEFFMTQNALAPGTTLIVPEDVTAPIGMPVYMMPPRPVIDAQGRLRRDFENVRVLKFPVDDSSEIRVSEPWPSSWSFYIIIDGPPGVGKTNLIIELLTRIYAGKFDEVHVFWPNQENETDQDMLGSLPVEQRHSSLASLMRVAHSLENSGKRALLVLNDIVGMPLRKARDELARIVYNRRHIPDRDRGNVGTIAVIIAGQRLIEIPAAARPVITTLVTGRPQASELNTVFREFGGGRFPTQRAFTNFVGALFDRNPLKGSDTRHDFLIYDTRTGQLWFDANQIVFGNDHSAVAEPVVLCPPAAVFERASARFPVLYKEVPLPESSRATAPKARPGEAVRVAGERDVYVVGGPPNSLGRNAAAGQDVLRASAAASRDAGKRPGTGIRGCVCRDGCSNCV